MVAKKKAKKLTKDFKSAAKKAAKEILKKKPKSKLGYREVEIHTTVFKHFDQGEEFLVRSNNNLEAIEKALKEYKGDPNRITSVGVCIKEDIRIVD